MCLTIPILFISRNNGIFEVIFTFLNPLLKCSNILMRFYMYRIYFLPQYYIDLTFFSKKYRLTIDWTSLSKKHRTPIDWTYFRQKHRLPIEWTFFSKKHRLTIDLTSLAT